MAQLSKRNAAYLLTPALKHLGHDPDKFNVYQLSTLREKIKYQKLA